MKDDIFFRDESPEEEIILLGKWYYRHADEWETRHFDEANRNGESVPGRWHKGRWWVRLRESG